MGFPHQVLPIVAVIDMVTAVAASVHLGLLPLPRSLTVQGQSMLNQFFTRLQGSTPTFASHKIIVERSDPKKLLLWMLVLCLTRCLVIILVWTSIKGGIQNGRVRSRSEDYSGRAIVYSIVCVLSVLINLSNLNTLFQTRGAPPDASLSTVLFHISASSLAAEQLIVSGIEWLLFAVVAGTNGLSPGGTENDDSPAAEAIVETESANASEEGEEEETGTMEQDKESEVQTAPDNVLETPKAQKDYGSLTELRPRAEPAGEPETIQAPRDLPTNDGHNVPSSSNTSNGDSPDPSAMSSDIVDIPKDRKASMMGARERLNRARENGNVRRRSIWKKLRGKGNNATPATQAA